MNESSDEIARKIADLAGADDHFDTMVNGLLGNLRQTLVPPGIVDPTVESEFSAAREKLDEYREQHRDLRAALFQKYLGNDHLSGVKEALETEPMRRFMKGKGTMERELVGIMGILLETMRESVLYGDDEAEIDEKEIASEESRP